MQIIILGMHRSGTSMLARLINMMGVYFGEDEDAIGTNNENPKGFWERQDIRTLNDSLLHSAGLDWDYVSKLNTDCFTDESIDQFKQAANEVIAKLDKHKNWLLKEPRLNILLGQWKAVLNQPIYIYVYRTPVEVALSLKVRNEIPRSAGAALWELYNKEALKHITLDRTIFVSHRELIEDPVTVTDRMFDQLVNHGVENISKLSESDVLSFVSPKLHRQKQEGEIADHVSTEQLMLHDYLAGFAQESAQIFENTELSINARESLEDYELFKDTRARLEQTIVNLELSTKELTNINNQTLGEIDDILLTSRWRVGNAIINALNMVRGNIKTEPAFMNRVLDIRKRLEVNSQKFANKD